MAARDVRTKREAQRLIVRRHRLHGVRAADVLHARFGETEVLYLACVDQLFHRCGDILDRNVRIDALSIQLRLANEHLLSIEGRRAR